MRELPQDHDAERALVATMCAPGNDSAAVEIAFFCQPEHFVDPRHRSVFEAAKALASDGTPIDPLTLKAALEAKGNLGRVGGFQGIVDIISFDEVAKPMILAERLKTLWMRRQMIRVGHDLMTAAYDGELESKTIAGVAINDLSNLESSTHKAGLTRLLEFSSDQLAAWLDRMEGKGERGTRTGFDRLDRMTHGGFRPGQLIVLGARPGIGKTALVGNWSLNIGRRARHVGFFSLEMTKEELHERLVGQQAGLNVKQATARYDQAILAKLAQANEEVSSYPIFINDTSGITVPQITAECDRHMHSFGRMDLVVIDYLQLITWDGDPKVSETRQLGEMTRRLKVWAKDRRVPVVLLSQLNRDVEARQGRPQLSDLRSSGAIEQDADIVGFIHRNMKGEEPSNDAELILAKHRGGPLGIIPLLFQPETTRYIEVERETDPPPAQPARRRA